MELDENEDSEDAGEEEEVDGNLIVGFIGDVEWWGVVFEDKGCFYNVLQQNKIIFVKNVL